MPTILAVLGIGLFICCGCGGLTLIPGLNGGRQAARRMQAGNSLKQIVLALQNYHDTHGTFPPAVVTDSDGKPLYSGRVLLLPFMEERAIYNRFDKSKAWDSPENLPISQTSIQAFECLASSGKPGRCDFVFVSGPGTAFEGTKTISYVDIVDGSANTLFVIETKAGPTSWAAPVDWDASSGPIPPGHFPGITLAGFADGHVMSIATTPPNPHSRALSTINGREELPADF